VTRESKLAVILGFAVVLVVAALISDHFSHARQAKIGTDLTIGTPRDFGATPPGLSSPIGPTNAQLVSKEPFAGVENTRGDQSPGTRASTGEKEDAPRTRKPDEIPMGRPNGTKPPTDPGTKGNNGERAPETAVASLPYSSGKAKDYKIQDSDSLYKIAKVSYGDASLWEELAEYNKGRIGAKNALRVGATLVIPPKDVLLGKAQLAPAGMTVPEKPTKSQAGNVPDTRMPDERKFGGTNPGNGYSYDAPSDVRRLAINDADGRKDRIVKPLTGTPAGEPDNKPGTKKDKPDASADSGAKVATYIVRRGDHLSSIAKNQLGSAKRISDILKLNPNLDDEDSITEGMVLKMPAK